MKASDSERDTTKAGVIRHAQEQIGTWRSEGMTYGGIARRLSESSELEISAETVRREIYRARKREKKAASVATPAPVVTAAVQAPTDEIAERLARTSGVKMVFNPKPNPDDLI